ncbi:uncharacterized protein LOC127835478 [Dreissena polymorpha]|uniref:C1q domain-containing protein n=1 Tax=Dreissena polymorpha TaxID=45954 RepID=A0A9D4FY88_DREPO|nr:uncharacterized protein LOC127835478 [Dreissena polymorpha]KAH3805318.1 hypothetical protein DPMN_133618 [Dreissena polymorpha]
MLNCVGSWIFLFILGISFALEPSCPVCSKYEYEEKLLERVIRNELALKDTLDKITETQAKVEHTLTQIKDKHDTLNDVILGLEVTKQNVSETVKLLVSENVKDFEVMKQKLRSNVDDFINLGTRNVSANVAEMNSSIQSFLGKMSKEVDILRAGSVVPVVMFYARLQPSGSFTYTKHQAVVFKTVLVNVSGGYDPDTGQFTASVAGVYMFTVQYCTISGKTSYFEIVHDGKSVQRSQHGHANYYGCVTMQAFAMVAMGEKVWVRSTLPDNGVYQDDVNYWNSFAGMLIRN